MDNERKIKKTGPKYTKLSPLLELLIRVESELPKSRYVDFRLVVYYTEKHL